MREQLERGRGFVYRNARPLELARWKFHFEGGPAEEVLRCLSAYQNPDGGFGHALEPDFWNPASTPIATWMATRRLWELGLSDAAHPIVQGILRYLDSGRDFFGGKWCNTVAGNNDHPHAVWWTCNDPVGEPHDNPTVSLAGFVLRFAAPGSALRERAAAIAAEAVARFLTAPVEEMHTLRCYQELLCHCELLPDCPFFALGAFREKLWKTVDRVICKEPEKWYTEYVCKPSFFYESSGSILPVIDSTLLRREAELMREKQQPDGAWPVTWQWWTEYPEAAVSANWWRSSMLIDDLCFLRAVFAEA